MKFVTLSKMKNFDARKFVVILFAITVCAVIMTVISSFVYYGPGSGRKETVDAIVHLIDIIIGAVIMYLGLKDKTEV